MMHTHAKIIVKNTNTVKAAQSTPVTTCPEAGPSRKGRKYTAAPIATSVNARYTKKCG